MNEVLEFWFGSDPSQLEAKKKRWFGGGPALDEEIRTKFGALVEQAGKGELDHWHETTRGRLAWLILVDQFSRNLYRDRPEAFAHDLRAQQVAREGFDHGGFATLPLHERMFGILPFTHAEDLDSQRLACTLSVTNILEHPAAKDLVVAFEWTRKHLDVIARFGRFPHRNKVLGRTSTPDEVAYLELLKLAGQWL